MSRGEIHRLRRAYHQRIVRDVLRLGKGGAPNNADGSSKSSVSISKRIVERIGGDVEQAPLSGQTAGRQFEAATKAFLSSAFTALHHLRPGDWEFSLGGDIADYQQYQYLHDIKRAIEANPALRVVFGDYIVKPDIVVCRRPVEDAEINKNARVLGDDSLAGLTPLRRANSQVPILHASVSCKWTIRSDRSQNARTEGLNLARNRKGSTPRVVVVVGEPLPARIASIALGTGDIDCVYHFALPELEGSAEGSKGRSLMSRRRWPSTNTCNNSRSAIWQPDEFGNGNCAVTASTTTPAPRTAQSAAQISGASYSNPNKRK